MPVARKIFEQGGKLTRGSFFNIEKIRLIRDRLFCDGGNFSDHALTLVGHPVYRICYIYLIYQIFS